MPGNRQVFSAAMNAADRHRWDSQWAEATREYQRALAEFPEDAIAHGGIGFCYIQTKQWTQALQQYEYVLTRDSGNVIALSKIAEIYTVLHRQDDAYKTYLHLATLYSQAGQGARAEAAWQKAVQMFPGNPEPHEQLAAYYFKKNDAASMIQERLAAAQGHLVGNNNVAARIQCEEVLRADTTNVQAGQLLLQMTQGTSVEAPHTSGIHVGFSPSQNTPNPFAFTSSPTNGPITSSNLSGGNTGIMGNAENSDGMGRPHNGKQPRDFLSPESFAKNSTPGNKKGKISHKRVNPSQVTGMLKQAQTLQTQGRFDDATSLCEQILESGFDRPDARYFLGWLYQEQQRWDEAIRQFQLLLNDPEYALSCSYALGQCYRTQGDLRTATLHFDEAVDRVNLDALTVEESDQLVQLCQEAAEAHRMLGEQEQALTVYHALLGFLRSRGWSDKIAQAEFMLQQAQSMSPPPAPPTRTAMSSPPQPQQKRPPVIPSKEETQHLPPTSKAIPDGELPGWLTGILSDAEKNQQQQPLQSAPSTEMQVDSQPLAPPMKDQPSGVPPTPSLANIEQISPILQMSPAKSPKDDAENLLGQIVGSAAREETLKQVAEAVLISTATLPENVRLQVVRSMQDIQNYISHGLLSTATEECLRVIEVAPQYLDVHLVLCEIYVRQGKIEQAITKYGILVDTYLANGRIDDAATTYRLILQLEPNNLTYRTRLIQLLSSQGNKEELLRERTRAAESYLRLGYRDQALTELEQALQESPTSVSTRLNYALALQKLGRIQQAAVEYQRVLQVDPRNITALVRWHIAMITHLQTERATTLELLTRIRWQLRGEGQRNYEVVAREYNQATDAYPNNADIHFALGQIHQQSGFYDKAIDSYLLAMRDSAMEVLARVSTAQALLAQGKPEAAIQHLEQALHTVRNTPDASPNPATWAARPREESEEHQAPEVEISVLLAKAYGHTGRQEQMQTILRRVKQIQPEQGEASSTMTEIADRQNDVANALHEYTELVQQYRNKRQIDSALSVLQEMIRLAPQDPVAHDQLGEIYMSRGLLEEAIAELRILTDIHLRYNRKEEAAAVLERIGNAYAKAGNTEEAFTALRRAIEISPNSVDLLREMVGFCLQLGRTQDAAQYQNVIAHHYYDTHQIKEAVAALQQLITIDRNNYEAYDLLGQTYQSVGEYEQAIRVYKNLAKVSQNNAIARQRLAKLQELRSQ